MSTNPNFPPKPKAKILTALLEKRRDELSKQLDTAAWQIEQFREDNVSPAVIDKCEDIWIKGVREYERIVDQIFQIEQENARNGEPSEPPGVPSDKL